MTPPGKTGDNSVVDVHELRERYEAIRIPDFVFEEGDVTWIDRLIPFENFLKNGPVVASLWEKMGLEDASTDLCPELASLVQEAFMS